MIELKRMKTVLEKGPKNAWKEKTYIVSKLLLQMLNQNITLGGSDFLKG